MRFSLVNIASKYMGVLFFLGLITFTLLGYILLLVPEQARITKLASLYQTEVNRIQAIEAFAMAYPDPDRHLRLLSEKILFHEKLLPDQPAISEFLLTTEQAAKNNRVQLARITPGQETNKNGYREVTVEMITKGDYFQTMNFLKQLEAGPRFSSIAGLSIQSRENLLESRLIAVIYCYGASPAIDVAPVAKPK